MDKTRRQRIRYLRTVDGLQLAWAEAGQGPLLVKASNWLTHLEYDWESPSGATGSASSPTTSASFGPTNGAAG